MVVKKCPECDQTLPVACKSCHCGHVFISRRQLMPTPEKLEPGDAVLRDKRLRPEIPKREIQDYEYEYSSSTSEGPAATGPSRNYDEEHLVSMQLQIHVPGSSEDGTTVVGVGTPFTSLDDLRLPERYLYMHGHAKRKRGRPKGSKNKPKANLLPGEEHENNLLTSQDGISLGDDFKRKRGRPKGSKNKPKDPSMFGHMGCSGEGADEWSSDQQYQDRCKEPVDTMPHVSKEKAITYSIVLSDINQKMMKQSSMNFV